MPVSSILEERKNSLPVTMPVVVVMECRKSNSIWLDESWHAVGVTGDAQRGVAGDTEVRVINQQGDMRQLLYPGFNISLYADECESYYHNLISPEPGCYVITRDNDEGVPIPYIVTPSFDEANAYLECEGEAFTVPIPAELYRWMEEFVLQHYMPEKRVKRKRKDWRKAGHEQAGY